MRKPTVENLIYAAILMLLCYLGIKLLFPVAVPFIIAAFVAVISKKAVSRLGIKKGKAFFSSLFAFVFYIFVCTLTALVGRQLYFQISGLCSEIAKSSEQIADIVKKLLSLPDFISGVVFPDAAGRITGAIAGALESTATALLSKLPFLIGKIASAVPNIFLFAFVTVTGTFYLCSDGENIKEKLMSVPILRRLRLGAVKLLKKAALAYFLIFLLMFSVLFFGFSIIGVKYALAIAALTAFADVLPVLGTGAVLVPWAAIDFMSGNSARAFALAAIWIISSAAHRIAEPRLLGEGLGIPPVISLASMYAGYKLLGAAGIVLFPLASAIVFTVIKVKNEEAA